MKRKIFSVKVRRDIDESPDTFYIGKYTDIVDDWNIDRRSGKYIIDLIKPVADCEDCEDGQQCSEHQWDCPSRGREFRFFTPYSAGEIPGTKEFRQYGLQDFKRMEELCNGWCFIGIRVVAEVGISEDGKEWKLETLSSGGVWGIESDSDASYFKEIITEESAQLKIELKAFGFSSRMIAKAFDEMEECH